MPDHLETSRDSLVNLAASLRQILAIVVQITRQPRTKERTRPVTIVSIEGGGRDLVEPK